MTQKAHGNFLGFLGGPRSHIQIEGFFRRKPPQIAGDERFSAMSQQNLRFFGQLAALIIALLCGPLPATHAADRIQMVGPPPSEEIVKSITESLAKACNSRNVPRFLSHFTSERAGQIRRHIEDLLICHDIALDVREAFVLTASESEIVFGVRYELDDREGFRMVLASRVTARKIDGEWLLESEEVLRRKQEGPQGYSESQPLADNQNGARPVAGKPDWAPRDVGWIPGGCAGGKCGL